jgi:hypothetical protein
MENEEKKEVTPQKLTSKDTVIKALTTLFSDIIIYQKSIKSKENKSEDKKPNHKILSWNSSVRTLNLKFYSEQLMYAYLSTKELSDYYNFLLANFNDMKSQGKDITLKDTSFDYLFNRLKARILSLDSDFEVMSIVHDKCTKANPDDIFELAILKPHMHMVIKKKGNKTFRVSSCLKELGIHFRRYVDNKLWIHGVSTCGNFASSVAYLTHETDKAMRDGKYLYDRSLIVSNLPTEAIDDYREGYLLSSEKRRLTQQELAKLDKQFFDWGHDLKDFNALYNSLNFIERSNSKIRTIKESYYRGIEDRINNDPPYINRMCLFIQGPSNTGKTYSLNSALTQLGEKIFKVSGGGTGKFDKLAISDTAILIDDESCPNPLNMSDSRITTAYKRQNNNPYWTGEILVVTSNIDFFSWCEESNLNVKSFDGSSINKHGQAMKSRFILAEVKNIGGTNQIFINDDLKNLRGTPKEREEKILIAKKIINLANEEMKNYKPQNYKNLKIDYTINLGGKDFSISFLEEEYKKYFDERFGLENKILSIDKESFFTWLGTSFHPEKY